MTLIFVYGTLKRGGNNHHSLAGQTFLGEARTPPGFRLYHLDGYPGMIAQADDHDGVTGEVWSVDQTCLAQLDLLEGLVEGLYRRVPAKLMPPFADRPIETYVYARSVEGRPALGSTWRK
ncbi:MAG: gamma-glutamylcyclotransferase family protein [Opitutaceae bacterium]